MERLLRGSDARRGSGAAPDDVVAVAATPLEAGEVLRVELRHFEMGWAGLHVKDTVLVTRDGARSLNRSNCGLVVLN
jgi:Xaa-Pro aminopeptidase